MLSRFKELVGWRRVGGPLIRRYVALFLVVVCIVLLTNSVLEIGFFHQDHKASLIRAQREQAETAATKIGQFIRDIESQVGWTTQLPWSAGTLEQRRFDATRLLRQVPAITELAQLDPAGKEQLRISRVAMDVAAHQTDFSQRLVFTEAMAKGVYYGPVYFRRESEPYMTLALAGARRDAGVSVVDVNLKLIWDAVTAIKVGERGQAFVIDEEGRLIAHPNIHLVLRYTDMTRLAQVQAARASAAGAVSEPVRVANDIAGREVFTTYAPITPLGWLVFVELPTDEAYAPLHAAMQRSGALLLAGLALVFLAGLLFARSVTVPIHTLRIGAERLGSGDLTQRISIKTGDEFEALADQFNSMATKLQESHASLERKVEERTHQLKLANLAKSRFLAAASHDLRQPMQALTLFVAQLRDGVQAPAHRPLIDRIAAAVATMNELFTALLDISKLDAGAVTPNVTEFPIARVLARIETTFAGAALEKKLALRVVSSRAWVRSDAIMLERILLNLVSNAVRYTPHGKVVVGCRRRAETLRIEVYDSGPGIAEDQHRNIFEEFYQVAEPGHEQRGGIGLGLAIVDRLCRLLGHSVELTSAIGKGSRFTIIVARAAAHETGEAPASPSTALPAEREQTAVVIDDAPLVLDGMDGLLRSWGFRVVVAESCDQALERLADRGERPSLIVSNYHLQSGRSGIEAIEHLRDAFEASIPGFLMSGDTGSELLELTRAKGYFLLHKPVNPMRLRAVLNRILGPEVADGGHAMVQPSAMESAPFAQP
jgi:signal transduction histidine kinase